MPSMARNRKKALGQRQRYLSSAVRTPQSPTHRNIKLIVYGPVITNNFDLLAQAVENFDARFTLRALRSISSIRKADNLPVPILLGIRTAFPKPSNPARRVLEECLPKQTEGMQNGTSSSGKGKDSEEEPPQYPEVWAYLGVLVQV